MRTTFTAGVMALGLLGASFVAPAIARAETLTDALIGAYRHSGLLEQNRATLRAADEDVVQAVALLRPVITYALSTTYARNFDTGVDGVSSDLSLTMEQLLFDFGGAHLAREATKETVLATREALIALEMDVLFRAVQAYLAVRNQSAQVNLRQGNLRLITQELRAARDRFEVGDVTRTDVAIAESRLAASRAGLAVAQGALTQAREAYRLAVGRYPGDLAAPPIPPRTASSYEDALAVARRTHPDIRRAMRLVTVAEINIARATAAMKPRLTLRGSVGVDDDFDSDASLTLRLAGTMYQGGALSSALRQAQARRDANRGSLHNTRHLVDQKVGNAWSNIIVAAARVEASIERVRASTVAFRGVQEEATLGARTTLDVLNAEQELLDARAAQITAETDRIESIYDLLCAMGLMTVDHLGLGIVTYDPAAYYNAVKDGPTRFVSPQGEKLDRVLKSLGKK